jgi:hypothetical protein
MWQWRKKLIERNNKMGSAATIAINIAIWLGGYALVTNLHRLLFHFQWVHSTSEFTFDDVAVAVITGCITGALEWSDRDKKRQIEERKRQGTDATII